MQIFRLKQLEPLLVKKKGELNAVTSQTDSEERKRSNLEQQVWHIEVMLKYFITFEDGRNVTMCQNTYVS